MRSVAKVVGSLVVAAGLLLIAGAIILRPPADPSRSPGRDHAASALTSAASLTIASGSLDGSIEALQAHVRAVPRDATALARLGQAYVSQARITADPSYYPKADRLISSAMRLSQGRNPDALLGEGALALARHDFAAALRVGRRAAQIDPYDPDVYGVIGDAQLELGRYRAAFSAFQRMVDTKPELASYARVAYARELLGQIPAAVDAMRMAYRAAGTASDRAWAAFQLGELEWNRGRVESARDWYRSGLRLDERFVPNEAGLAKVAWARGDLDTAVARYDDVVARYPSVEYLTAFGDLYASMGEHDLAREQYAVVDATRRLQEADGVDVDLEIALFEADHGDPADAVRAARAEWSRRHSIHVADAYAWALYRAGRASRAEPFAERALSLGTRNATFLFHAGMIERELEHRAEGLRLLRAASAVNPNFSVRYSGTVRRIVARAAGAR